MKKPLALKDDFLKNLENMVYEIKGKHGIQIEMRSNNTIKSIVIPDELKKDPEFAAKLIESLNEAILMVSEQFAEEMRANFFEAIANLREQGNFTEDDLLDAFENDEPNDDETDDDTDDDDANNDGDNDSNPS